MINSKEDYIEYIQEDRKALNRVNRRFPYTLLDWPLRFQLIMRRAEYYNNCKKSALYRPIVLFWQLRHRMMGNKCGYTIPLNTCGYGLRLIHLSGGGYLIKCKSGW